MIFDIFTLLACDAVVAAVMACVFVAACLRQRDARCWPAWIAARLAVGDALLAGMADSTPLAPVAA